MGQTKSDKREAPRRTGDDRRESEGRRLNPEDRRETYAPADPERRSPGDRRIQGDRRQGERRSNQERREHT